MKSLAAIVALAIAAVTFPAVASHGPYVDGEVRRVDKDAGKITLKHDPIPNLEMMAMTMVFTVKDRAMLEAVKPGDKVKFKADNVRGALTVTEIRAAR